MTTKMPKNILRDLAKAVVFAIAQETNAFAFDDSEDLLTEDEQEFVLDEIAKICEQGLERLGKKHGVDLVKASSSVRELILQICYE